MPADAETPAGRHLEASQVEAAGVARQTSLDRVRTASTWLGRSRIGLPVTALFVGAGAGLAAVGFRWLIFAFTWLATGHEQFGQQGRIASSHLEFLGIWFVLLIPVLGGLLYGPIIDRHAKEARGHGVPEVMLATAKEQGKIRPQVTLVKALASALCIGAGGSVGREGPIVQVGSAWASTVGRFAGCRGAGCASSLPVGPPEGSPRRSTLPSPASSSEARSSCGCSHLTRCSPRSSRR